MNLTTILILPLMFCQAGPEKHDHPQPLPAGYEWKTVSGHWQSALYKDGTQIGCYDWARKEYHQMCCGQYCDRPDALDEVNAARARRGLAPFLRDEGLTLAAMRCAEFRAARGIQGHTGNDFSFVPAGTRCSAAGCAAWPPSMGWGSCCAYDNYRSAGASWAIGRDGQRYMSLFVR